MLLVAPAAIAQPTSGTFMLDTEMYRGMQAAYGEVHVEEDGSGGLHMMVSLDPAVVGDDARVKRILLSVDPMLDGLRAIPDDPDAIGMHVRPHPHSFRSMGAGFDAVVSVWPRHDGNGQNAQHRSRRDEPLHSFSFTLVADEPLALDHVLGMQATWRSHMTQIGVTSHGLELGRRHHAAGMLGGLFEPDPEPQEDPPGMPPAGATIPPGCLGEVDPVTGEILWLMCP